jgi:hypothetical protein
LNPQINFFESLTLKLKSLNSLVWNSKFSISNFEYTNLIFCVFGILSFWVCEFLGLWVSEFEFLSFWVSEFVISQFLVSEFLSYVWMIFWASQFLSFWVSEFLSFWINELLSFWISEFLSFWVSQFLGNFKEKSIFVWRVLWWRMPNKMFQHY